MRDDSLILQEMGIKELRDVTIRAKTDIQYFGKRAIEAGEPILYFDHIQFSVLQEESRVIAARGGLHNEPRVIWENRGNLTFTFSNGTLNYDSFALLLEAQYLKPATNPIIHKREQLVLCAKMEDTESVPTVCRCKLTQIPIQDQLHKIFVFLTEFDNLQEKLSNYTITESGDKVALEFPEELCGKTVTVDYYYEVKKSSLTYTLARERMSNVYTLEATFSMKDENSGEIHSGIIELPKVSVESNINLRLGERSNPMVGQFTVIAMPELKDDVEETICKITLFGDNLNDEDDYYQDDEEYEEEDDTDEMDNINGLSFNFM